MDLDLDPDAESTWIIRSAGFDPDDIVAPRRLAETYSGNPILEVDPTEVWGNGQTDRAPNGWQIMLRRGLDPTVRTWTLAHETAEIHLAKIAYKSDSFSAKEAVCDAIAACLLMPRRHFMQRVRARGRDFVELARAYRVTETAAALRVGETVYIPLAVVGPTLRVRGPEYGWPTTIEQMRRLAQLPAPPGLCRTRLTDDPRRVVLTAEYLEAA